MHAAAPAGAPLHVLSVTDEALPDGTGLCRRVRLRLSQGAEYVLWLRDTWASTPVEPGDTLATSCAWRGPSSCMPAPSRLSHAADEGAPSVRRRA